MRACLIFVAALVLVTHAAEDTATVTELAGTSCFRSLSRHLVITPFLCLDEASPGINAAVGTHQSANSGGVGHGYFNDVANFVGPKYGLPGYKESHTWETGNYPSRVERHATTSSLLEACHAACFTGFVQIP